MNCQPSRFKVVKLGSYNLRPSGYTGALLISMSSKISVDVRCMTSYRIYIIQQKWVIQLINKDEREKKSQRKKEENS